MFNYLLQHAVDNVWCNNDQDHQYVISAHKVTQPIGVLNYFKFMNRYIVLPVQGKRCHVYQIGQIHPRALGLLSRQPDWTTEVWHTFKDAINNLKLFCNIYTKEGLELPRYKTHYMFTNEKALIIVVEEDVNYQIDFSNDAIYLRLYSNAYYESIRGDSANDYLFCSGRTVLNANDIISFQAVYNTYAVKSGYTYCYKNGYLIDSIDLVNVSIGDTIELVYDSSIKKVVTFTVNNLLTFLSDLDSKYKYLLHHHDAESPDTIDYQDDIDIHVLSESTQNRFKGFYYHRNVIDSHRMVTHRDYSIVVDYFTYVANALNQRIATGTEDIRSYKLQVKIRHSGYQRPLIFDNNRIFELYKLNDDLILQAMLGINATVPEWQAANLESSAYTEIMRSLHSGITLDLIQRGYGYNSLSKLLGDTPQKTTLISGLQTVQLPYNLHSNVTVYEYDGDGYYLNSYYQANGYDYSTADPNTRLIEAISGKGTVQPNVLFGTDHLPLPTVDNYRVYMCYVVNSMPDEQWRDITGSELYTVVENTLIWSDLETNQFLMIRSDDTFLAYDIDLHLVGGLLFFTLAELEDRDGYVDNYTLPIPLGELDIIMNGRSLIRDIDYVVKFPEVYIISKRHLVQPVETTPQRVHVRFTGFCKVDLTMDDIEDRGYIEHGFLSNNNRHDIRDDKVLKITVNGSLKHRDDLVFSELHDGVSMVNPINGHPYQIKDIVVPLKQLVDENTYSLRDKSIAIDKHISDYLTVKLPQPERDAISTVTELYPVVSPFIARIIADLLHDVILPETVDVPLTDMNVIRICKPYEYLLDIDPVTEQRRLDMDYVIVHPTLMMNTVEVTVHEYRFLLRVLQIYSRGLVEINNFVAITASGV